jgi:hypothetical protein
LRKAAVNGETENEGSVVVGQNVGLLKKMQSAEEIVAELVKEYTQILSNVSKHL